MHIDQLIAALRPGDRIIFHVENGTTGNTDEVILSYDAALVRLREAVARYGDEDFNAPDVADADEGPRVVRFGPGIGAFAR